MWYNSDVQVGHKSLVNEQLACRNIKLIDDFVDEEGYFLSYEAFSARHPDCKVNYLVYMGWKKAIPGPWTQMLVACHSLTPEEREKEIDIEIKTKKVALSCVKPSFFNACCTPEVVPSAQKRWIEEGVDFGENWRKIYLMPYQVTKSTKLQSLQFRILNRYFPTKRFLFIRNVVDDPFCDNCGEVETIHHCFFECSEIRTFWEELTRMLNSRLPLGKRIILTRRKVIFGGMKFTKVINFIVLLAKQFISRQRAQERTVNIRLFRSCVRKACNMDRIAAMQNRDMERLERWSDFVDDAGQCNL